MPRKKTLVDHLHELLRGGHAHPTFEKTIAGWPAKLRGVKPPGAPHTAWQLLEHLRICQWDILEFSRRADHVSPEFPAGYWPKDEAPQDAAAWDASVAAFKTDLAQMEKLVADAKTDLFARIPHGDGQTVLREALVLADHNAYHVGQLVLLRRSLGAWKD
jgi:DinB superfamily